MTTVEIKFFGALRKFESNERRFEILVDPLVTVAELKLRLIQTLSELHGAAKFNDAGLIYDSAVANDYRIFNADECVGSEKVLSLLPPVCGG